MKWWILLLIILTAVFILLPLLVRIIRYFYWKKRKRKNDKSAEKKENASVEAETKKENASVEAKDLIDLRIRMERTNFWFHLVRNNPRHREQYYFALIAMVGYENWKNVEPTLRMNWESARLSFDRMYGMVKDFAEQADYYADIFPKTAENPEKINIQSLHNTTTEILRKTGLLSKEVGDKTGELSSKLAELEKKFDSLGKILPPRENAEKVRDALNQWIPPKE